MATFAATITFNIQAADDDGALSAAKQICDEVISSDLAAEASIVDIELTESDIDDLEDYEDDE